ncbi:MAG: 16S rRNA (uracil(1498)-N(3))-methyltransferase [Lentisphaeria bacterium]|nr:16S rRNA (uracil(1498)-N(3))-methyltransferase [Lentisphaeria bacterium]
MNLLLLTEKNLLEKDVYCVEDERALHIQSTLHAKAGDRLKVGLLGGNRGEAVLLSVERNKVLLRCGDFPLPPPSPSKVIPILSLPRPQSFKKVLHVIASSGIRKAYFIHSEGVEKSYWKSSALEKEAVEKELFLGLEQGCDTILPRLEFRKSFSHFLAGEEFSALCENADKLVAHPYHTAVPCPLHAERTTLLAIGPESGYRESEVDAFLEKGFQAVTLGDHILRVEFALAAACGRLLF